MRGNHNVLFRNDYSEPAPITADQRALVQACVLVKRNNSKFWHDVYYCGKLVGCVATYMSGQVYRPIGFQAGEHLFASNDWHPTDPALAGAVLRLLEHEVTREILLAA
jgi:hypothetical protein